MFNQKEESDRRAQAMVERSRHKIFSKLAISQDYYEFTKTMTHAYGNNYHIFKPNNFRDFQKLYQDKASMDMTLKEFKLLTSACWSEKY